MNRRESLFERELAAKMAAYDCEGRSHEIIHEYDVGGADLLRLDHLSRGWRISRAMAAALSRQQNRRRRGAGRQKKRGKPDL